MKPPKKAIKPMMIRNIPCIPSKATTITFPGEGFLRDACNNESLSIDGISPKQNSGAGALPYKLLQTQYHGLTSGAGVSTGVTFCSGNSAAC